MNFKANATNVSLQPPVNLSSHLGGLKTHLREGQTTAWKIAQVLGYYAMILFSLIGNTVVIKAVKRIGKTLRRQVHYIFIVNLSVADLLFALENIPIICTHLLLNGAWKVEGPLGSFLCRFDFFLSLILILTSNLTIFAIAVEKFCGIFFPLRILVSKKRAFVIIASSWLVGGLYASPLLSSNFAYLQKHPDGNSRCHLCIKCEKVVQWFIFQTVLLATVFVTVLMLYSAIGIKIWFGKTPGMQLHECQRRAQAKKYRTLKMLAMMVVLFYISFIPFWIYQLSIYFSFNKTLGSYYGQIAAFLMYCNGAVNPLIYSVYNLEIRSEFKALLRCKKHVERPRSHRIFQIRRRIDDLELKRMSSEQTVVNKSSICYASHNDVNGEKNVAFTCEDTRL